MIFKEFGDKSKPTVIFLHGGGMSWWMWKAQIEALKQDYRVIAPVLDGHGEDCGTVLTGIEALADKVIGYIRENCGGKVRTICGLSLGAQTTVEILSREKEITENAVVESALVYPMKTLTAFTVPMTKMCYGLIKKEWYAKLQAKSLLLPESMFTDYFKDSSAMTLESVVNMLKRNGLYSMPPAIAGTKAKVLVLAGEKELPIMKRSAKLLHDTIPGSRLVIAEKSGHGEMTLNHPEKYLELIQSYL